MVVNLGLVLFGGNPKIGFKKERAELDVYFNFFFGGGGEGVFAYLRGSKEKSEEFVREE